MRGGREGGEEKIHLVKQMRIDGDRAEQSWRMPSHITALIDLPEWQSDPRALEEVSH